MRLVEFNVHVARFAHPSWYEDRLGGRTCSGGIFDARGHIAVRAEPHVSRWLLHELGLQGEMDWEMDEPQKRLWLLDGPSLERLALELALAMHREWLVRVIDATRWRALRAKVSGEALRFVVDEVPEGCFHYQSPLVSLGADSSRDISTDLKEHGARTLIALLQPAWLAARGRAQLYFDRTQQLGKVAPFEPTHCQRALELICGRLIPRRFPEWAWCF